MRSSREITVRAIDLEALGIEISYINSDNLHDIQKAQANSKLIAAAPELLAALQTARNGIAWYIENSDQSNESDNEALVEIDAAIAKATQ
jgi:hypothetical protein